MKILGIDPSLTSTGTATLIAGPAGTTLTSRAIKSVPPRRAKGDKRRPTIPERAARLRDLADCVIADASGADLAVIEEPIHGVKGGSVWDRAGLWWQIVGRLHRLDIPVAQVNSTTRRIWATGVAGASKAAVSVHMARLWPDLDADLTDDQWDAVVFATMAGQHLGLIDTALARHREQIAKVTWPDVPGPVTVTLVAS